MEKFPAEFSDFIKSTSAVRGTPLPLGVNGEYVRWIPNIVKPIMVRKAMSLLEQTMGPFMRTWNTPIPKRLISELSKNFQETLPKTFRNDSIILNTPRTAAFAKAKQIGLLDMLSSDSLRRFAEKCSGYVLDGDPGIQLSRYKTGDFVGPHNDHHPEDWNLRDGYIDLHITLTNGAVYSQYFIYEDHGVLNRTVDVSVSSGVSVSCLPYWHQVTPLVAKKGKEKDARRWLLLVSFSIIRKHNNKNLS